MTIDDTWTIYIQFTNCMHSNVKNPVNTFGRASLLPSIHLHFARQLAALQLKNSIPFSENSRRFRCFFCDIFRWDFHGIQGQFLLFAWTLPNKKSNKLPMGNGVDQSFSMFQKIFNISSAPFFASWCTKRGLLCGMATFHPKSPRQLPVTEWLSSDEVRSQIHQARFHEHLIHHISRQPRREPVDSGHTHLARLVGSPSLMPTPTLHGRRQWLWQGWLLWNCRWGTGQSSFLNCRGASHRKKCVPLKLEPWSLLAYFSCFESWPVYDFLFFLRWQDCKWWPATNCGATYNTFPCRRPLAKRSLSPPWDTATTAASFHLRTAEWWPCTVPDGSRSSFCLTGMCSWQLIKGVASESIGGSPASCSFGCWWKPSQQRGVCWSCLASGVLSLWYHHWFLVFWLGQRAV